MCLFFCIIQLCKNRKKWVLKILKRHPVYGICRPGVSLCWLLWRATKSFFITKLYNFANNVSKVISSGPQQKDGYEKKQQRSRDLKTLPFLARQYPNPLNLFDEGCSYLSFP